MDKVLKVIKRNEVASQTMPGYLDSDFVVGAPVNDGIVLANALAASPVIRDGLVPLVVQKGARSASQAFNQILDSTRQSFVIFAHQDVYLPRAFMSDLRRAISLLDGAGSDWAVLGVIGKNKSGEVLGTAWSNGLQKEVGFRIVRPEPIVSLDELLIVCRRGSGIRFDSELPDFHLYGTDIVLSSLDRGLGAYVFDGRVIHNSLPVKRLGMGYELAYRYMQRKWKHRLPLETLVVPVTKTSWPLYRQRIRTLRRKVLGVPYVTERHPDPASVAKELEYDLS